MTKWSRLGLSAFSILFLFVPLNVKAQHAARLDAYVHSVGRHGDHVYQWMVSLDNVAPKEGTTEKRRAFLWIPPSCEQVKGIVVSGHNMIEEGILEDSLFRCEMAKLDFAELWVTPDFADGGVFDVNQGAERGFLEAVNKLADVSGYNEVRYAPVVYFSHSAQGSNPWNFAAWNPERTLAAISYHGDSPRSTYLCCNHFNPDWGNRTIDGIPGLLCVGSDEFNEFRIEDAFRFMKQYPKSTISFLCNDGRGHFDFSQEDVRYLIAFIQKAEKYRQPLSWNGKGLMPLKKLNRADGWAADRWHKHALPASFTNHYNAYRGPKDSCFWYMDEEMARWTESIYTRQRNKKKQYVAMMQDGKIVKPFESLAFITDGRNITVHAKAVFTDSTYTKLADSHSIEPIYMKRICGPFTIVNDSTFRLDFYRPGIEQSGSSVLYAEADADLFYGHAICHTSIRLPQRLHEGKKQKIKFPKIQNVKAGTTEINLKATSDSGLPVSYYVEKGPAFVDGNRLVLTPLPLKTRYPVEITVVAWQYGSMTAPKVQSADPVKINFLIE